MFIPYDITPVKMASVDLARDLGHKMFEARGCTECTDRYREGAPFTDRFGFINKRGSGALIHTGTDRGFGDGIAYAPFDCLCVFSRTGGAAGTILRLFPAIENKGVWHWVGFYIDIFHCSEFIVKPNLGTFGGQYTLARYREPLAMVGSEGFSTGSHTHTEVCVPCDVKFSRVAIACVQAAQGKDYDFDEWRKDLQENWDSKDILMQQYPHHAQKIREQFANWNMKIVADNEIQRAMPQYRGGANVYLLNSQWYFGW